jgi:hypothetical protein
MKARFSVLVCFLMVFYAGECLSDNDEICQTWVNTNYVDGVKPQKLTLNYDGTFQGYKTKSSHDPIETGVFQVAKKWKDSEENIIYQIKMSELLAGKTKYMLARVNKTGDKLIFCCDPEKYPDQINESLSSYCSYERESTFQVMP